MLLKNCYIENSRELVDIAICDGKIQEIKPNIDETAFDQVIDLNGKLVLPPFVESHIHLDASYTAQSNVFSKNGTLFDGISDWAKIKNGLQEEDIYQGALKAVKQEVKMGVQAIRTHVDTTSENLMTVRALAKLKQDLKNIVDIQLIAFPQDGLLSCPGALERMDQAIGMGVDGIGAIPHFEYTREYSTESLNYIMNLAAEKDLLVDVHCDETDDDSSRGLETLVARAIEYGLYDRVTASHTTAMHSYNDAYVGRIMRHIQKSRINFVANPLVNVSLQGKFDTYPKRRGMTRVKELLAADLNVSFGHDDIQDPWYPMGCGNPLEVISMGIHLAQMLSPSEIQNSYKLMTHNGAKTLHISEQYGIEVGKPANMIVLDAPDFYQALVNKSVVLYSIRGGNIISATEAPKNTLYL